MTFYLRKLEEGTLENHRLFKDLTKRISEWARGYPGERGQASEHRGRGPRPEAVLASLRGRV